MKYPSISLIITTSPGREENLRRCLNILELQSFSNFEVLVTDDGSTANLYECSYHFPLTHIWRPNDCCPGRSRNIGASKAKAPLLVLIDSDILLNPNALAYYAHYFSPQKKQAIYGYYGNDKALTAPSCLYNGQRINWYDERFHFQPPHRVTVKQNIYETPPDFAWSGNFAIPTTVYWQVGGFNESFIGWGGEDVAFAHTLLQAGISIHFSWDVWAEHQIHSTNERFHQLAKTRTAMEITDVYPKTQLLYSPEETAHLQQVIQEYIRQN